MNHTMVTLLQIELVGKSVNYSVFGGQAQFEDMVRNAKDQAARKAKRESY